MLFEKDGFAWRMMKMKPAKPDVMVNAAATIVNAEWLWNKIWCLMLDDARVFLVLCVRVWGGGWCVRRCSLVTVVVVSLVEF